MTQARQIKRPVRTCVACRTGSDKRELVRFVRSGEGVVTLDPTGRVAGRGAYLCTSEECWSKARKAQILDRALRVKLSVEDYERLEVEYGKYACS